LYFAFKVMDDIHVQTKADTDLWHGDHMELQFDTLLEKDYNNPGMNDDDCQIGLSVGDFDKVPPAAYAWFNGPEAPGVVTPSNWLIHEPKTDIFWKPFSRKPPWQGSRLQRGRCLE
jgi:hypothetical protein